MKKFCLMVFLLVTLVACQNSSPAASSEGDLEAKGIIASADGRMTVSGKSPLLVSLKNMSNPAAAPTGWEFVAPVFDVTAQDRQQRPMQKLAAAVRLRFDAPLNRAATVMVYGDKGWEIVPSEVDAEGKLTAEVDHFTPYTVASPAQANPARAGATIVPKITPSPKATVVKSPASTSDATAALESAVTAIKNKKIKVTSAAGYTGSLYVPLPDQLSSIVSAISVNGSAYYGLYNAVNEAITAQAKGNTSSGSFTLLVEPKTTLPASASDARTALATAFPNIPVSTLSQSRVDTSTYIFYGTSGNTAYGAGYVVYNGVTLAYAAVGTGTYQPLVPKQ
ncbi:MAG: hypothetical protein HZB51_26155 [Chloroflexi bacterium]|nr:hypothetical protein [Chloroflexota bacterium]